MAWQRWKRHLMKSDENDENLNFLKLTTLASYSCHKEVSDWHKGKGFSLTNFCWVLFVSPLLVLLVAINLLRPPPPPLLLLLLLCFVSLCFRVHLSIALS